MVTRIFSRDRTKMLVQVTFSSTQNIPLVYQQCQFHSTLVVHKLVLQSYDHVGNSWIASPTSYFSLLFTGNELQCTQSSLHMPWCTVQAPNKHCSCSKYALIMHCTVRYTFVHIQYFSKGSLFLKHCLMYHFFLKFLSLLFFFKDYMPHFWIFIVACTYFFSTYKLYCVVLCCIVQYGM